MSAIHETALLQNPVSNSALLLFGQFERDFRDHFVGIGDFLESGRGRGWPGKVDFEIAGKASELEGIGLCGHMGLISFEIFVGTELIFLIDFSVKGLLDDGLDFHVPGLFGASLGFVVVN